MYILVNFAFEKSSLVETTVDDKCLKSIAFGAKYKTVSGLEYKDVLIPLINVDYNDQEYLLNNHIITNNIIQYSGGNNYYSDTEIYSLFVILKDVLHLAKNITIDNIRAVTKNDIGIFYSDGSSSKDKNAASFGCCKLLKESSKLEADDDTAFDCFTNRLWDYEAYNGIVESGTNNVGELSGLKFAIENFSDKQIQIIISDSIYGIKCYREYIHNWKNNGYKAYNGKEIKNKELITETYKELTEAQNKKIVLFKWTKGHNKDQFNEICDTLAKDALGIIK